MFNPQEQEIIKAGRVGGKSPDQIEEAIRKYRTGYVPPAESTSKNLAIGFAKGVGGEAKTVTDALADAVPGMIAGPVLSAVSPVKSFLAAPVQAIKNKVQGMFGLTDENLAADNTTQQVGKGMEVAASFLTPFMATRFAGLASRSASLATKLPVAVESAGIGGMIKRGVEKTVEFVKNPRLAIAKTNVGPQLEASAERLVEQSAKPTVIEGTERLKDPVGAYDKYFAQSKKSQADIKVDNPLSGDVAASTAEAFKSVVANRRAVGATMGAELKKVGGIKTNIADAYTNLETALKEADLIYNGATKKLIGGNASKMTREDVSLLEQYVKELNKLGTEPTISQIDATIARTQGLVNNFESAKGITETTNAERLIKQSQNALRDQLDPAKSGNKALTKYAEARKQYADLSDFIDEGAGFLGKITQSGDFAKDASLLKSAVQSMLNSGKKDWLIRLEELTGYPALDDASLALQAMKDAGDFKGLSLLETLSQGHVPASASGLTQKMIDYALAKVARVAAGTPEEQTRIFLNALAEAAQKGALK